MKRFGFFCIIVFLLAGTTFAQWSYRNSVQISSTGLEVYDIQVLLKLHSGNFDYNQSLVPNGGDIRISSYSNASSFDISYWIETWNSEDTSLVWVKIPHLEANNDLYIYIFSGNPEVTDASNPDQTLIFYDDFANNDWTDKWLQSRMNPTSSYSGQDYEYATMIENGSLLTITDCCQNDGVCPQGAGVLVSHELLRTNGNPFTISATLSVASSNPGISTNDIYLVSDTSYADPMPGYDRKYGFIAQAYGNPDRQYITYPTEHVEDVYFEIVNYNFGTLYNHILSYDGQNTIEMEIFQNGVFIGQDQALVDHSIEDSLRVMIYVNSPGSQYDKIMIYTNTANVLNSIVDPVPTMANYPSEIDLVAYYPLDGNALDVSGNNFHGQAIGNVTGTTDRFGNVNSAMAFDGVDDCIDIDAFDDFGEMEFSYSGWFQSFTMDVGSQSTDWVINTPSGAIAMVPSDNYNLDEIILYGWGVDERDGGGPNHMVRYASFVDFNEWYHFVLNVNGDSVRFYINGELTDSTTIESGGNEYPQAMIGASGYVGTAQGNFNGKIDEIRIYSRMLSDTEIDSLYRLNMVELVVGADIVMSESLVKIPINVVFPVDSLYRAAEFNFSGYPAGLEFIGIDTVGTMIGGLDWTWAENEVDGVLQTAFAGSDEITGDGVFCYLEFLVTGDICTTVPVNCDYALFNDVEVTDISNGAVYIEPIPVFGDVDGNGLIQALDASDILMYLVDSLDLDCQAWTNANVYLDTIVDAMDASIILQSVVDSIDSLPVLPDEPAFLASGTLGMEAVEAINGSDLLVPLILEQGAHIFSYQGEFTYNPDHMTFVEVENAFDGFVDVKTTDDRNGHVKFATYRSHDAGPAEGVFAQLRFTDVQLATGTETGLTFESFKLNGNLNLDVGTLSIVSTESEVEIPSQYTLKQNYPNPFNPTTMIRYGLPEAADVSIIIYDITGRQVTSLVQTHNSAGWYDVQWNGVGETGNPVSTGMYFARITAGSYNDVIKMVYLR